MNACRTSTTFTDAGEFIQHCAVQVEHAVEGEGMVIMVMPDEVSVLSTLRPSHPATVSPPSTSHSSPIVALQDPWNGRITVKFFEVENCLRFEKDGLEEPTPGADGKISELQITMVI